MVLLEGLRCDRQEALPVDQTTLHSPLFTLHPSSGTGGAAYSSGSPVKLLKNPRRVSRGLAGRKASLSRLNP